MTNDDQNKKSVLLSWSGGKDSALSLIALRNDPRFDVVGLISTVTPGRERLSYHDVPASLIRLQATTLGLPLHEVELPEDPCPNEAYEESHRTVLAERASSGVEVVAFGDLFLADLREYREALVQTVDLEAVFPLWGRETAELLKEFIHSGLRAKIICVDPKRLSPSFLGRELDAEFERELPPLVDPCGENGEYHSFVYSGPIFDPPIPFRAGGTVHRDGRAFVHLEADTNPTPPGARNSGIFRGLACFAVFVAVFLLATNAVRSLVPWPNSYGERDKFRYFSQHKDEFDLLLFGSSMTYRTLVPSIMERELASHGLDLKIFNLGQPGMNAFEIDNVLREVVALEPARLKAALVEIRRWDPTLPETIALTDRAVFWHTTAETRNALRSVSTFPKLPQNRLFLALDHLRHWLRKQTGYGAGISILSDRLGIEKPRLSESVLEFGAGYRALEEETDEEFTERRRLFLRQLASYRKRVARIRQNEQKDDPASTYNTSALRAQVDLLRDAGVIPIHISLPRTRSQQRARFLADQDIVERLLSYDRPNEFPFLYDPQRHFDDNHLDRDTSAHLSRIVARELAWLLSEETD